MSKASKGDNNHHNQHRTILLRFMNENNGDVSATLKFPTFPSQILYTGWASHRRTDRKLLGIAVQCIRCTFAAMCAMNIHAAAPEIKLDCHNVCATKFQKLVEIFNNVHKNASAGPFLTKTTLTGLRPVTGKSVWTIAKEVRRTLVNNYNRKWENNLGPDGQPPSGRSFQWVANKVLVQLFRARNKIDETLPEDSDIDQELATIRIANPLWGLGLPREWEVFMGFGLGVKVGESTAKAHPWTIASVPTVSRKRPSDEMQSSTVSTESKRPRAKASMLHDMSGYQSMTLAIQKYCDLQCRRQRIAELKMLMDLDPAKKQKYTTQLIRLITNEFETKQSINDEEPEKAENVGGVMREDSICEIEDTACETVDAEEARALADV